jgi:hypothetical protein
MGQHRESPARVLGSGEVSLQDGLAEVTATS